ncbi:MAG: hypothetical protein ABSB52_14145 [Acidimicrobiales bacterium]|jgi:aspartate/methionine/tyrosine aminotransferase
MSVWGRIPGPYGVTGSLGIATLLVSEEKVTTPPGREFAPGAEGCVQLPLIENEVRIAQGIGDSRAVPNF